MTTWPPHEPVVLSDEEVDVLVGVLEEAADRRLKQLEEAEAEEGGRAG